MFYGVIVSHMLVVLFAACGISGLVAYLGEIDTTMGYPAFLKGLAEVSWPLAVAAAIYMLVQIACQIQQMVLAQRMQGVQPARRMVPDDDLCDDEEEEEAGRLRHKNQTPRPAAAAPKPECRKPVSFFDISDAAIPPIADSSRQEPGCQAPAAAAAQQDAAAPVASGEAPDNRQPGEQAPSANQQEADKQEPQTACHFFTLD